MAVVCNNCRLLVAKGISQMDISGETYVVQTRILRGKSRVDFCERDYISILGTALLPLILTTGAELMDDKNVETMIGDQFHERRRAYT